VYAALNCERGYEHSSSFTLNLPGALSEDVQQFIAPSESIVAAWANDDPWIVRATRTKHIDRNDDGENLEARPTIFSASSK
jgi:hypothetical protein